MRIAALLHLTHAQWFINRSWQFKDAYQVPLSGKAAAWAVRKQKGHRTVFQSAMMHLDAIVHPT
jgi:hypothetical protein